MNRSERRARTAKIAKKRFSELYCNYNGKPNRWFLRYSKHKQAKSKGECRDRRYGWRCRCEWCLGGVIKREEIADFNFTESLNDAFHEHCDVYFLMSNRAEKIKATNTVLRHIFDGQPHWGWSYNGQPDGRDEPLAGGKFWN